MKKIYLFSISLLFGLSSCNYLDVDDTTGRPQEYMYKYFDETKKLVTFIYSRLPSDWGTIDGALRESATDNAVHVWTSSNVYAFYNDGWSQHNTIDSRWEEYYTAIRSANSFLKRFSLKDYEKFANNIGYNDLIQTTKMYPYEVRFLRAFYYFELAKRYGDAPLETEVLTAAQANSVEKTSFHKVIDFIADECDAAMVELPDNSFDKIPFAETGRITKGACMALKARALLYAASPLYNPENNPDKWERAARAAWDLIQKNWYQLVALDAEPLWKCGAAVLTSKQLILESRSSEESSQFEANNFPIGYEGGNTGTCPSQNLVDAFEMKNGTAFSWENATHKANPYNNRDPRLAITVLHNGAAWKGLNVQTFVGGRNGQPINGASLTGYYLKKGVDPAVSLTVNNPAKKHHHYVLFRYAEVLLNYAEAMSEWKGPTYKDGFFTKSAIDAVNEIRTKVPVTAMNASNFTVERLRNERRVELAFEDHRFWDLRRWKIGDKVREIYGIKITIDNQGTAQHEPLKVQERIWNDKMYLYPIPYAETRINKNLTQNKGW